MVLRKQDEWQLCKNGLLLHCNWLLFVLSELNVVLWSFNEYFKPMISAGGG